MWPRARVTEVFPNQDGLVRSVQLLVVDNSGKKHSAKRPIAKLVLICEAIENNAEATDNEDTAHRLDATGTTKQPATLPEPEMEIASSIDAGEEELITESDEASLTGISNVLVGEKGVAMVNPNATAEKQIAIAGKQLLTDAGPKPVPRALKRLASFNKPGAKEVGAKTVTWNDIQES